MSLIGSLEDLNLGDILQIISLSQKSGVLILSGETGEGRIVFREGLVCAAVLKGGAEDLRGLLVDGGHVASDQYQSACDEARKRGIEVREAIVSQGLMEDEEIEAACRVAVERSVMTMFRWRRGDFSFDVRTEPEPDDPTYSLSLGVNAQYLAMESARVGDEGDRESASSPHDETEEMSAHEMFGVSPDPEPDTTEAVMLPAANGESLEWGSGFGDGFDSPVSGSEAAAEIVAMAALETVEREEDVSDAAELILDTPVEEPGIELVELVDHAAPFETDDFESACEEVEVRDERGFDPPFEAIDENSLTTAVPPVVLRSREIAVAPEVFDEAAPFEFDGEAPEADFEDEPVEAAEADESGEKAVESEQEAEWGVAADVSSDVPPVPAVLQPSVDLARIPVVVIDPDLPTLEWAKAVLAQHFDRVHIFQRSELGLSRIRQYLVRMESPLVLISPETGGDRLAGIGDAQDFVRRLRHQGAQLPILWLCDQESPSLRQGKADGIVLRPSEAVRRQSGGEIEEARLGEELIADLSRRVGQSVVSRKRAAAAAAVSGEATPGVPPNVGDFSPDALRRLKQVTEILNEGASRGEVLPVVIRFASESFQRVAMFVVRDEWVEGIAQSGLHRVGGPDDADLKTVRMRVDDCEWFRRVIESKSSAISSPTSDGDRILGGLLGDETASQAYVAPILGAGQVVALLYADNLPGQSPPGDTSALEVVLHHAGLALDRAVLERALAEIESESGSAGAAETGATGTRKTAGSPAATSRNAREDR